jgi:hypothetical protein
MKLLFAIFILVVAAIAAAIHFHFNAVILLFMIIGFGVYMVGRNGGPALPKGFYIPWRTGGIDLHGRDYVKDDDAQSGEDEREGDGFR